ncbi:MAG: carboxypeptidase-like regulatory domain-containing protein [bacterium]|nr:carboxypeptidase-like regulatory domain-containing protein [bacterium]
MRFAPASAFGGSSGFELVVNDTITFGVDGRLDFRGRTPYAEFDTVGPQAPTAVTVGNPTMGFPDQINRANLGSVQLHVTTPVDAAEGDTVVARIYGFDPETSTVGDIAFEERTATVPAPGGQQTVVVDFSGALGTLENPAFEDGGVDFAVQMRRGDQQSGYFLNDPDAEPRIDVTPPTLTAAGPPGSGDDIFTDLEQLAFHGMASEEIGAATLSDGVNPDATLFGAAEDGFFTMSPVALGRLSGPRGYTLTITDRAGNMIETAVAGNIIQRGTLTGMVSGTLTVEAYDHATLAPIANATVVVDPGVPTVPATGQLVATTDSTGLATFTGLATMSHTVTIVADGYGLTTLYDTAAARVSLPLRPLSGATASFSGTAVFQPTAGTVALIGNNAFDDPLLLSTATTTADPTTIPTTDVTANRAQVVTAFGGTFEPTMVPAFSSHGYAMLGPTLLTTEASAPPVAGGETTRSTIVLLPSTGVTSNLATTYGKDFALADGLDTANLVGGGPSVRVTASLSGFAGQALAGVGLATNTTGANYTVNATYGLPMATGFVPFAPSFWVVTEARDSGGRVSRHRALLVTLTNTVLDVTNAPGVPEITNAGTFMGSPLVTFEDELDPAPVPGNVAMAEIIATDPAGRPWTVMQFDPDVTGGSESVQFPDLSMVAATGLATGTWSVRVEGRALFSLTTPTPTDLVLSELRRQEASFARSAAQEFTVQ